MEEFVVAQYASLRRVAYLLCGDPHQADDLTQAALAQVCLTWSKVSGADDPAAYAHKVLINLSRSWKARRWNGEVPTAEVNDVIDLTAEVSENRVAIRQALLTLPRDQREAVVVRHLIGLPEADAARLLGCPAGTVKSRTSRGLAALRPLLSEHVEIP